MSDPVNGSSPLTSRLLDVLRLVARGLTNAAIASELGITFNTTRNHVASILDKLGVASREEAARWFRSDGPREERPLRSRRRALRALAPIGALGWPLKQVGAVAAVVLLGGVGLTILVALIAALGTEQSRGDEPVVQPELHSTYAGEHFEVFLAEDYALPEAATLVTQFDGRPWVAIMDIASGEIVARVETAYQPMALLRRSTGEVLISDAPGSSFGPLAPRLLVFDARDDLRLVRTIAMPERNTFTTYARGVVLSADERYVFYSARDNAVERPLDGCASNMPYCDRILTGVIDLDTATAEASLIHLVDGACSIPRAFGGALAAIVCENPGRQYLLDGASGQASAIDDVVTSLEKLRDPDATGQHPGVLLKVVPRPGGEPPRMLFLYGSMRWLEDGAVQSERFLPPGTQVVSQEMIQYLPGDRLLVGFTRGYSTRVADGVAAFNLASGEIAQVIPLEGIVSLAAAGSGTAIAGLEDGSIVRIDLAAGTHDPVPGLRLNLGHRWSISTFELIEPRGTPVPDSSNPDELFHLPIYVVPG